jgi:hypothetical protein
MKAKMKVKGPLELEFETTGTKINIENWLDRAYTFLQTIPTDNVYLKLELKELQNNPKEEEIQ